MTNINRFFILAILIATSPLCIPNSDDETQEKSNEKKSIHEILFSPNTIYDYSLSPDGDKYLYTTFDGSVYKYNVKLINSDQEAVFFAKANAAWVGRSTKVEWIDNNDILGQFYKRDVGINSFIYSIKHDESGIEVVEKHLTKRTFILINPLPHIEDRAIFAKHSSDVGLNLHKVDIKAEHFPMEFRAQYRMNRGTEDVEGWLFDHSGDPIISHEIEDDITTVKQNRYGSWKTIFTSKAEQEVLPISIESNNTTLNLMISDKNTSVLRKVDLESGKLLDYRYPLQRKDFSSFKFNPETGTVIAAVYVEDGIHKHEYIGEYKPELREKIIPLLDREHFNILETNVEKGVSILVTRSSDNPGAYYLYQEKENKLTKLNDIYQDLSGLSLQKSIKLVSKASDGVVTESYLLPALNASDDNKSPLIVMPHGGPIGVRDYNYFNKHAQLLSQLGYSVLMPNYRGSSGFGTEFLESGQKQWGRMIEEDIYFASQEALKTGYIDKNQVCIFGISYGGYSALMSAIKYPDFYRCAASYAGVTDLSLLYSKHQFHVDDDLKEFFVTYIGDPDTEMDQLVAYSPVYNAEKIKIPVLVAQGGNDSIVDFEHYNRMLYFLKKKGVKHESLFLPYEIHGFKKVASGVKFFKALDTFFKQSLNQ